MYADGVLEYEARGGLKACATFMGYGHYICGIDGSAVEGCGICLFYTFFHTLISLFLRYL